MVMMSMMSKSSCCLVLTLVFQCLALARSSSSPVVGILTQPLTFLAGRSSETYIAASYVKWLESGGARSIAIPYEADKETIDAILGEINAVFLPGGNYEINDSLQYLLDKVVELNERYDESFFPVWGTCMGFEIFIEYASTGALQSGFDSENITLPLEQLVSQELYVEPTMVSSLQQKPITMNNHGSGIEPESFYKNNNLTARWNVTSINHDRKGRPFVSTIEPKHPDTFPFYAVQYHPEKNAFEYSTYHGTNIPYEVMDHSDDGVFLSFTLARFFVGLARRNKAAVFSGRFPLVQSYPVETGMIFEQFYLPADGVPRHSLWYPQVSSSLCCFVALVLSFFMAKEYVSYRKCPFGCQKQWTTDPSNKKQRDVENYCSINPHH